MAAHHAAANEMISAAAVTKPVSTAALRALSAACRAATTASLTRRSARGFTGCRSWSLLINRGNPREFVVVSEWDNLTVYETRMRDASWVELTGLLPDLAEGEMGFELYDVIS